MIMCLLMATYNYFYNLQLFKFPIWFQWYNQYLQLVHKRKRRWYIVDANYFSSLVQNELTNTLYFSVKNLI